MTFDSPRHERLASIVSHVALIASITVFITFIYRIAEHSLHRRATSAIPTERPNEGRRIFHPTGFSIIRPEFWKSKIIEDRDHPGLGGIKLWSPSDLSPGASLEVAKLISEPTPQAHAHEVQFQGQPAWLTITHHDQEDFEQPGQLTVELTFSRDNSYWLVRYDLQRDQQAIPKRVWEYMETFLSRVPKRKPSGNGGIRNLPKHNKL